LRSAFEAGFDGATKVREKPLDQCVGGFSSLLPAPLEMALPMGFALVFPAIASLPAPASANQRDGDPESDEATGDVE
jgi:hypothetical protein